MKILVTGGCGFIGSTFIKHMLDKYKSNIKILNVDSLTYAGNEGVLNNYSNHPNYSFAKCTINAKGMLRQLIKANQIDTIVNFAAETHVDKSIENSEEFIMTNIHGTHTLLTLLHEFPSINKFIQISTDEVYGSLSKKGKPFTEKTPLAPNSPYAASKASADMLCRSFYKTYGYPIIITRCSNNYGPNQYPEKLIPLMIQKAKNGEKLPVYGKGDNIRDWIHVKDHCEAIDTILHYPKYGEIYNIGGENEKTNIEIVTEILKAYKKNKKSIEYVKDRLGHDFRYSVNISKIKNELGWSPKIKFKDGIKDLLR